MTDSAAEEAEYRYLTTTRAIRERAGALFELAREGKLENFRLDEARLNEVADLVVSVTKAAYPDVRRIPYHSRFRHFSAGGVDRARAFEALVAALPEDERLMARFELVIASVLLDAGAGATWSYRGADGARYTRSEGLAVASYDWFVAGGLSSRAAPRIDTARLLTLRVDELARAFQVSDENPLVGLEGRTTLLKSLGRAVQETPTYFGASRRLGALGLFLRDQAQNGELPATSVLTAVLEALGPIWPGRGTLAGRPLGDVWAHPAVGKVPFHKLSQWLTYSLCEALELSGVRVTSVGELTGLAEYRNGGLFVDGGVLVPAGEALLDKAHDVGSPVVVEWRALTVALLDRTAELVRARLGLNELELPLARVLEGGTWAAGRKLALARRAGGAPPLRIASDGTVF
jgi:hypothetical protein